jgi:hypothetical protein
MGREKLEMSHRIVTESLVGGMLLVLGAGSLGCSKKASGATGSPAASATVTAATAPLPQVVIPLPPAAGPLAGRLQEEAAHRPTGTPTAEAMFGTLQLKGVALHEVQQYMGHSWGARYCAGAETDHDVFLSVCEFDDPKSAAEGKKAFEQVFAANPRPATLNKASVLTVRDDGKTPESAQQMKMISATFASLP